jgi:hypothetical protein
MNPKAEGVEGSQPMRPAVHGSPNKLFGDLTPYLTYGHWSQIHFRDMFPLNTLIVAVIAPSDGGATG